MKKAIAVLFLALSTAGFGMTSYLRSIEGQMSSVKDAGRRAELTQQYNSAYRSYLNSIQGNPEQIFSFGESLFADGKYEKAREVFSKDVKSIKNLFGAATTSRFLGDDALAVDYYSEVLDRNPKFYEANLGRGICYRNLGQYDKALSDLQIYMQNKPTMEIYMGLGDLYMLMGRVEDAKRILEAGRAKYPNSSEIRELLVTVYSKGK